MLQTLTDKLSLRAKLMALLIAVGLIPLGVVAGIAYNQSSQALTKDAGAATEEIAFNASDKLDRTLFERYGDAQTFATDDAALSMDPARIRSRMDGLMAIYAPVYSLMIVADLRGRIVATNSSGSPLSWRTPVKASA